MSAIARGEKPGSITSSANEEFAAMWPALEECWRVSADDRPTAAAVQQAIQLTDSSVDDTATDYAPLVGSSANVIVPASPDSSHQAQSRAPMPSTASFIPGVANKDSSLASSMLGFQNQHILAPTAEPLETRSEDLIRQPYGMTLHTPIPETSTSLNLKPVPVISEEQNNPIRGRQ
ncbi:hypothetical protein FRC08_005189 [Ceratobasidium sp. 394]|nr:hypothetical protein FRC08_005189 [Ceratobasidium sp. 394]